MEILRLEGENRALRELLTISVELPPVEEEAEPEQPPSPADLGRRKSSLTVEELEAGAEKEAAAKERADIEGILEGENIEHAEGVVRAGPGLGSGVAQRPIFNESVLGFHGDMPSPEEAIDDSEDGNETEAT
jgi:hypothetical protein